MKKSDLIKLLENASDDQDINELILGSDEFKGLGQIDLSKITVDEFKNLLATNEGIKGYQQSLMDSAISKGVASYESNTLPKKIEEAIKNATNKDKTPEQIELEKLKKQFEDSQAELQREKTIGKYSKVLKEKGLPSELVDFIYGDGGEETIEKNIESITSIFNGAIDSGVKAKLGSSSYTPPADEATNTLNAEIASAMGVK